MSDTKNIEDNLRSKPKPLPPNTNKRCPLCRNPIGEALVCSVCRT